MKALFRGSGFCLAHFGLRSLVVLTWTSKVPEIMATHVPFNAGIQPILSCTLEVQDGGSQKYGPFLGPLDTRCLMIY